MAGGLTIEVHVALFGDHNFVDELSARPVLGRNPCCIDRGQLTLKSLEQAHEVPNGVDVVFHEDAYLLKRLHLWIECVMEDGVALCLNTAVQAENSEIGLLRRSFHGAKLTSVNRDIAAGFAIHQFLGTQAEVHSSLYIGGWGHGVLAATLQEYFFMRERGPIEAAQPLGIILAENVCFTPGSDVQGIFSQLGGSHGPNPLRNDRVGIELNRHHGVRIFVWI